MLADFKFKDPGTDTQIALSGQTANVPNRTVSSNRRTAQPLLAPYETDRVAFEKQLEDARITRKGDPYPHITPSSLKLVASGGKHPSRVTTTPTQSCSANFYRCSKRRIRHSLRGTYDERDI